MKTSTWILLIVAVALLSATAGWYFGKSQAGVRVVETVHTQIRDSVIYLPPDTITRDVVRTVRYRDTIVLDGVVVIDTVFQTRPFTAYDTLITQCNVSQVQFAYPEFQFRYNIKYIPDTVRTITIFKDKIITEQPSIWERGLWALGGFALGYLIGR